MSLSHEEFIEGWKAGRLSVSVNRAVASRLGDSRGFLNGFMRPGKSQAEIFNTIFWQCAMSVGCLGTLGTFVFLTFWVKWYLGPIALFVGGAITRGMYRGLQEHHCELVILRAVEDRDFYSRAVESDVLTIQEREQKP